MYRCDITQKVQPPRTPCHKVVVETRPVVYINRRYNPLDNTWEEFETIGKEIVKEINVSPEGLRSFLLTPNRPQ